MFLECSVLCNTAKNTICKHIHLAYVYIENNEKKKRGGGECKNAFSVNSPLEGIIVHEPGRDLNDFHNMGKNIPRNLFFYVLQNKRK